MESGATSPAQNIAEGRGRQYKKEFIQFLYIAEGSLFEVVTLNEIFCRNNLFTDEQALDIGLRCEQIDRKLNGLIKSLKEKEWKAEEMRRRALKVGGIRFKTSCQAWRTSDLKRSGPHTNTLTAHLKRSEPLTSNTIHRW